MGCSPEGWTLVTALLGVFPIFHIGGGQWIAIQCQAVDIIIAASTNEASSASLPWEDIFATDPFAVCSVGESGDTGGTGDNWTAADGLISAGLIAVSRSAFTVNLARTLAPAAIVNRRIIVIAVGVIIL